MAGIVEHFEKGIFEERYWLPAHDKRRESALFRKNKKFIRDECGVPCWICGSIQDLEVHHAFEWAFWNALDPRKVTNILKAIEFYDEDYICKAREPEKLRAYLLEITRKKPIINTPDDARNLVVLCCEHHRFRYTGVHTISLPTWLAIASVPSEGGILTKEQLLLAAERVKKIDDELAALAENNYIPHRL